MLEPGTFPSEPISPAAGGATVPLAREPVLRPAPTRLTRYGVAAGAVGIAFVLRYTLYGDLDNRLPFGFFLCAVMVAGWYGGMGPGLFAAAAGLLIGDYFFLPPHGSLGAVGDAERLAISVYAINSTLIVVLMEHLHSRIRKLECALRKPAPQKTDSSFPRSGKESTD